MKAKYLGTWQPAARWYYVRAVVLRTPARPRTSPKSRRPKMPRRALLLLLATAVHSAVAAYDMGPTFGADRVGDDVRGGGPMYSPTSSAADHYRASALRCQALCEVDPAGTCCAWSYLPPGGHHTQQADDCGFKAAVARESRRPPPSADTLRWTGLARRAVRSPRTRWRHRIVGEQQDVEILAEIAGVESLGKDLLERKFELFEDEARPARRHQPAVAIDQPDPHRTQGDRLARRCRIDRRGVEAELRHRAVTSHEGNRVPQRHRLRNKKASRPMTVREGRGEV